MSGAGQTIAIIFAVILAVMVVVVVRARRTRRARTRFRDAEGRAAERAVQTQRLVEGVERQRAAVEVAQREGRIRGDDGQ